MKYFILLMSIFAVPAYAVEINISCTKPTQRVDGSPIAPEELVVVFYKNGELLGESNDCSLTYEETDESEHSYTAQVRDSNGITSGITQPVAVNLSAPGSPSNVEVKVTATYP